MTHELAFSTTLGLSPVDRGVWLLVWRTFYTQAPSSVFFASRQTALYCLLRIVRLLMLMLISMLWLSETNCYWRSLRKRLAAIGKRSNKQINCASKERAMEMVRCQRSGRHVNVQSSTTATIGRTVDFRFRSGNGKSMSLFASQWMWDIGSWVRKPSFSWRDHDRCPTISAIYRIRLTLLMLPALFAHAVSQDYVSSSFSFSNTLLIKIDAVAVVALTVADQQLPWTTGNREVIRCR